MRGVGKFVGFRVLRVFNSFYGGKQNPMSLNAGGMALPAAMVTLRIAAKRPLHLLRQAQDELRCYYSDSVPVCSSFWSQTLTKGLAQGRLLACPAIALQLLECQPRCDCVYCAYDTPQEKDQSSLAHTLHTQQPEKKNRNDSQQAKHARVCISSVVQLISNKQRRSVHSMWHQR